MDVLMKSNHWTPYSASNKGAAPMAGSTAEPGAQGYQ